jgi:hypothetical protein
MKKLVVLALVLAFSIHGNAQSEKFIKTMEGRIAAIDTTRDAAALADLAGAFERIGDAEKTQWLPYYYAALATVNSGFSMPGAMNGGMAETLDPIADKAEALLNKADELNPNNSEIYIIRKMIATLRMVADPMARYMKYGPEAAQALAKAKKLDPENPRVYLLEGQDKLFTPEQYGGSKTEAKKLLELALAKYDSFKASSTIVPAWGKNMTQYYLAQTK